MSSSQVRETALYIELEADETASQRLLAAVRSPLVQSILIRPVPGAKLSAAIAKPLIELIQSKGIAALVAADARLARTLKADGVHLPWSHAVGESYAEARSILGSGGIIGGDGGGSRHDAMVLAEAGADYVSIGDPGASPEAPAGESARETRRAWVEWWAPIFQAPCVALGAADAAEAGELASLGADFVGIALLRGETLSQSAERLEACGVAARAGGQAYAAMVLASAPPAKAKRR